MKHIMQPTRLQPQRGMSLIVILLLLVVISMLGIASMQIATMGEHGARNDRDMQLATQSAEAGIIDAEIDIGGIGNNSANWGARTADFKAGNARFPSSGCRSDDKWKGLCALETDPNKPASWLAADYKGGTNTTSFGDKTKDRDFKNAGPTAGEGGKGVQPALPPRYVIENVSELSSVRSGMVTGQYNSAMPEGGTATGEQLYRITAMGFGPRSTTQTVLQTLYRN